MRGFPRRRVVYRHKGKSDDSLQGSSAETVDMQPICYVPRRSGLAGVLLIFTEVKSKLLTSVCAPPALTL